VATVELTITREAALRGATEADALGLATESVNILEFALLGCGGVLRLNRSSVELVADVNKATLAAGATVVVSSLTGAGTTAVLSSVTNSNDTSGLDGSRGLTVDAVGVELSASALALSLEISSSLEVKVEVNIAVLLDLAKSEVELLLVIDIKILLEVATALDFLKVKVEVLLVSDIELLLEVLESSDFLASLEVSGATLIGGPGVEFLLGSLAEKLNRARFSGSILLPSEGGRGASSGDDSLEHCG